MVVSKFEAVDPPGYGAVAPFFRGLDHHLAVPAVFAGEAPARLYAFDPAGTGPRVALAWLGHRFYLAGNPGAASSAALESLFTRDVVPQMLAAGRRFGVFYYEPEAWSAALPVALPALELHAAPRQYWEFDLARDSVAGWRDLLAEDLAERPVDAALLREQGLQNLDRLVEETCSERPSVEEFLARSFGVCLVRDGRELAGWCLSEYNTAGRCEVGIEIVEPYRRRGLGLLLTRAFLEEARARGLSRVGWHCWAGNLPSGATARSAGFAHVLTYNSHWAQLDLD